MNPYSSIVGSYGGSVDRSRVHQTTKQVHQQGGEMIHLVNVTPSHYPYLYDLMALRPANSNISHKGMPTYEMHCEYWRLITKAESGWAAYMILEMGYGEPIEPGEPVGYVYLTPDSEIGVHVHPDHQRKGIARRAIAMLMAKHPRLRYLANVAPGNGPSHRLFSDLGGRVIQHTYEILC